MKKVGTSQPGREAARMAPLLRSISREVQERRARVLQLEARLFATDRRDPRNVPAIRTLESEIARHLRELRGAEEELARLGWRIDQDHPLRLLHRAGNGQADLAWQPEETRFYRAQLG